MDWRAASKQLQHQIMTSWRKQRERVQPIAAKAVAAAEGFEQTWWAALIAHMDGDRSKLVAYLRSGKSLAAEQCAELADVLAAEVGEGFKGKAGRPPDRKAQTAAELALFVYRHWKKFNKKNNISDHGHRDEMFAEALRFTVEDFAKEFAPSIADVDCKRVREVMERPASRRTSAWAI